MAYVVAISGVSGAGKTSVIKHARDLLGDAVALYFDDYAEQSTYPRDLKEWIERGANVDEWQTPHFAADLRKLRAASERTVLLVEEPFGKLRREMAGLIDLDIHIDVPADVLLARRLLRRLEEERGSAELNERVARDLNHHLALGRRLDALASTEMSRSADFVVDGTKDVPEIAGEIVAAIRQRL
jgi:uridine kinase